MRMVGVPSEQGSLEKNRGCSKGAEAIAEAAGMRLDDEVRVVESDIEETDKAIYEKARQLFEAREKCLFLGGDHSITYSLFKAFSEVFSPENSALVVFDAHVDAASFFKPVSHEDMNKVLIEEGLLERDKLLLVGTRKIFDVEKEFIEKNSIKTVSAEEVNSDFEKALSKVKGFLRCSKHLYVSIDVDVFDPSEAPGTGYLEENGVYSKEFFLMLGELAKSEKIKAADLVEVNPENDKEGKTVALAAEIAKWLV